MTALHVRSTNTTHFKTKQLFKMTSKELYQRFVHLCKRWPKDETKAGRDFADHFRLKIGSYFPHQETSQVSNPVEVDAKLSALERLANNHYYNENPLKRSSASGLEQFWCKQMISNDTMEKLKEEFIEESIVKRLISILRTRHVDFDDTARKQIESDEKQSEQEKK